MRRGAPEPPRAEELRVLQVIPLLSLGGLERVATRLTLGLAERVQAVAVAGARAWSDVGRESIEEPLRAAGIPVHLIPRARARPDLVGRAAIALAPFFRAQRPDVVHAHNPVGAATAALARVLARSRETAIVTTYHGVAPERLGRAMRVLALSSDTVVGVGPSSTAALRRAGLPADRSATIYNAFDVKTRRGRDEIRAELGIAPDAELIANVGRYVPEKNQALLLDALALLAPERPRLQAVLVGIGELEQQLRERADSLQLRDRVRVTGPRADAVDVTAAADAFVLSSDTEALPMALLEAMTLGVPAISTDVGGVRDAIRPEETGLLAPPRDARALADAIARVLDDAPLRERLRTGAREWLVATCNETAMVDAYLQLYVETVARRRARSSALRAGARPSK